MKPEEVDGNKWEKYFTKLYDKDQSTPPIPTSRPNMIGNDILNKQFTMEELETVIKKLKRKKAAGNDQILTEFLKAAPMRPRKSYSGL